jgi:hypothetical protein
MLERGSVRSLDGSQCQEEAGEEFLRTFSRFLLVLEDSFPDAMKLGFLFPTWEYKYRQQLNILWICFFFCFVHLLVA